MQAFRTSSCTTACHCKTRVANPVLTRHKLCQGIKQARLGYTQLKARPGKRGGCRQGCQPGTHPTDKCVPEKIPQGPWSTGVAVGTIHLQSESPPAPCCSGEGMFVIICAGVHSVQLSPHMTPKCIEMHLISLSLPTWLEVSKMPT